MAAASMVITAAVRNLFRRSIAKETIRICGDAASATVERSIEVLKRKFHPGSATEFHERAARPRGSAQALVCFSFMIRQEIDGNEISDFPTQPSTRGQVKAEMLASENPTRRRFFGSGREARVHFIEVYSSRSAEEFPPDGAGTTGNGRPDRSKFDSSPFDFSWTQGAPSRE